MKIKKRNIRLTSTEEFQSYNENLPKEYKEYNIIKVKLFMDKLTKKESNKEKDILIETLQKELIPKTLDKIIQNTPSSYIE